MSFSIGDIASSALNVAQWLDKDYQSGRAADRAEGDVQRAQNFTREEMQNKYQWQVADLKAAGLNPALAYGQAPAMGGSPMPTFQGVTGGDTGFAESSRANSARMVADAQVKLMDAQADAARADAESKRGQTDPQKVQMDKLRQDMSESVQRVQTLQAQATQQYASAAQATQQTENLKATLPVLRSTVAHLESMVSLNVQQGSLFASQIGKNFAEVREIQQRVAQNLPALQAAMQNLERQAKVLDMPRKEQEAGAHDSYVGALGAVLRILNPLNSFIK